MKLYLSILSLLTLVVLSACGKDSPLDPQQSQPDESGTDTSQRWSAVTRLPADLTCDWIDPEYGSWFALRQDRLVESDGTVWSLAAAEKDSFQLRLVLQNGGSFRALYTTGPTGRVCRMRFSQGTAASADTARALEPGAEMEYSALCDPAKDFMLLEKGSCWSYDYSFSDEHHVSMNDYQSSSGYVRHGTVELRIEGAGFLTAEGPVFDLSVTFHMNPDSLNEYGAIYMGDSTTTWNRWTTGHDTTLVRNYRLVIKGDSLYLHSSESETVFAPLEYDYSAAPYLGLFQYGVPDKPDLPLHLYSAQTGQGEGIRKVEAFEGNYGNSGYETQLTITLVSFTPGIPE